MSDQFGVKLTLTEGIGVLEWAGQVDQATLDRAISLAADDALIGRGAHRVEVQIPAWDRMAIRALHAARFRREGRRRSAIKSPDGGWADVLIYARLAVDQVYGPNGFSGVMNSVLPTHRVIGHVLFRDDSGRILLVEPTYKQDWELPGGVIEAGETPRLGAEREVLEETGLVIALAEPQVIDWMPPYLGWDDALEFVFDGGVVEQVRLKWLGWWGSGRHAACTAAAGRWRDRRTALGASDRAGCPGHCAIRPANPSAARQPRQPLHRRRSRVALTGGAVASSTCARSRA